MEITCIFLEDGCERVFMQLPKPKNFMALQGDERHCIALRQKPAQQYEDNVSTCLFANE
jgi:hypothetical protein